MGDLFDFNAGVNFVIGHQPIGPVFYRVALFYEKGQVIKDQSIGSPVSDGMSDDGNFHGDYNSVRMFKIRFPVCPSQNGIFSLSVK